MLMKISLGYREGGYMLRLRPPVQNHMILAKAMS